MQTEEVYEPLAESAPLALRIASEHCFSAGDREKSCSWYHGIWQYLRLLDVIMTIRADAPFLLTEFRRLAQAGHFGRILVAGSADYGMLAHLVAAYRAEGVNPEITVLDRCPTPLQLNSWYAERVGVSIETVQADVFEIMGVKPFDLICTHSFFSYVAPAWRPALTERWARLLRRGGKLLISQIVRPDYPHPDVVFSHQEAAAFRDRVQRKAEGMKEVLGITPQSIGEMAQRFAEHKHGFVVRQEQEILGPVVGTWFRLDHTPNRTDKRLKRLDVPAAPRRGDSYRIRFFATRL